MTEPPRRDPEVMLIRADQIDVFDLLGEEGEVIEFRWSESGITLVFAEGWTIDVEGPDGMTRRQREYGERRTRSYQADEMVRVIRDAPTPHRRPGVDPQ